MSKICPLCNSIYNVKKTCNCGAEMQDTGPAADYNGPYSPYFNLAFEEPVCVHLFSCPVCGRDRQIAVRLTG